LPAHARVEKQKAWTDAIETTKLVRRLGDHAFNRIEMTQTQIQAARILLGKTIPDLKAIEHSGEIDQNLRVEGVRRIVIKPK